MCNTSLLYGWTRSPHKQVWSHVTRTPVCLAYILGQYWYNTNSYISYISVYMKVSRRYISVHLSHVVCMCAKGINISLFILNNTTSKVSRAPGNLFSHICQLILSILDVSDQSIRLLALALTVLWIAISHQSHWETQIWRIFSNSGQSPHSQCPRKPV